MTKNLIWKINIEQLAILLRTAKRLSQRGYIFKFFLLVFDILDIIVFDILLIGFEKTEFCVPTNDV